MHMHACFQWLLLIGLTLFTSQVFSISLTYINFRLNIGQPIITYTELHVHSYVYTYGHVCKCTATYAVELVYTACIYTYMTLVHIYYLYHP